MLRSSRRAKDLATVILDDARDHYEKLSIQRNATKEQIEKAAREFSDILLAESQAIKDQIKQIERFGMPSPEGQPTIEALKEQQEKLEKCQSEIQKIRNILLDVSERKKYDIEHPEPLISMQIKGQETRPRFQCAEGVPIERVIEEYRDWYRTEVKGEASPLTYMSEAEIKKEMDTNGYRSYSYVQEDGHKVRVFEFKTDEEVDSFLNRCFARNLIKNPAEQEQKTLSTTEKTTAEKKVEETSKESKEEPRSPKFGMRT